MILATLAEKGSKEIALGLSKLSGFIAYLEVICLPLLNRDQPYFTFQARCKCLRRVYYFLRSSDRSGPNLLKSFDGNGYSFLTSNTIVGYCHNATTLLIDHGSTAVAML